MNFVFIFFFCRTYEQNEQNSMMGSPPAMTRSRSSTVSTIRGISPPLPPEFDEQSISNLCDELQLDVLLDNTVALTTLRKLKWFWEHNVVEVNMTTLNGTNRNRMVAAKTFAALLGMLITCFFVILIDSSNHLFISVLKKYGLIEMQPNEQNEIVAIYEPNCQ